MARRFEQDRLVIASHNPGKVREIAELLEPFGVDVISAAALALPEPEETGASFIDNALLKAHAAATAANLPALADDSGLAVNALAGAPGIYSARWAGPEKDFAIAMARVEEDLRGLEDRSAHFVCALARVRVGASVSVCAQVCARERMRAYICMWMCLCTRHARARMHVRRGMSASKRLTEDTW